MPKLFTNGDGGDDYFRSHDPLGATNNKRRAFSRLDPKDTAGGIVVLLLRNPLENFVRAANRHYSNFAYYPANIRFFTAAAAKHKAIFYYEDMVKDPATMARALEFLRIECAPGVEKPTSATIAAGWDAAAKESRTVYDARHGAQTKERPYDFAFHQRKLFDWQKRRVWRFLEKRLTDRELALLDRYAPDRPAPGAIDRLFGRNQRNSAHV